MTLPLGSIYEDPVRTVWTWGFAVFSLCRLFGDTRLAGGDLALEYYPRWRLRAYLALVNTLLVIGGHIRMRGADGRTVMEGFTQSLYDVERAFSLTTGTPESTEGLQDALGEVGEAQCDRLWRFWRERLQKELQPFAYGPLNEHLAEPGSAHGGG